MLRFTSENFRSLLFIVQWFLFCVANVILLPVIRNQMSWDDSSLWWCCFSSSKYLISGVIKKKISYYAYVSGKKKYRWNIRGRFPLEDNFSPEVIWNVISLTAWNKLCFVLHLNRFSSKPGIQFHNPWKPNRAITHFSFLAFLLCFCNKTFFIFSFLYWALIESGMSLNFHKPVSQWKTHH